MLEEIKKVGISILQFILDLFEGVSSCDVLWTIPVEGLDVEDEETFDFAAVVGIAELSCQGRIIGDILNFAGHPNFQALAGRVVDEEEHGLLSRLQITGADILPVSPEVGKAKRPGSQHLEEAFWASAKLQVGPAVFADGGEVEAIPRFDEGGFLLTYREAIRFKFHVRVIIARAIAGLGFLNAVSEGEGGEILSHNFDGESLFVFGEEPPGKAWVDRDR